MITISKDKAKLDANLIHNFLATTYWAKGRTLAQVQTTIEHSVCFGVYLNNTQIGFARVVSDFAISAYIFDVFILPEYRGNGYSKQLMNAILSDETFTNCETWKLRTADAQGLYQQFGFETAPFPERAMRLKK